MKLHVISDVHLETISHSKQQSILDKICGQQVVDSAEVLIIAGDLCCFRNDRRKSMETALERFSKNYKNVVYVPGNHEYWGADMNLVPPQIKDYQDWFGTHILTDGQTVDVGGVKFGGGTLWYHKDCGDGFVDFHRISSGEDNVWNQHDNFLKMDLSAVDVCVSHHFPTAESIHPMWAKYPNNEFFCAFIETHLVQFEKLPKLWVHGHTHNPFDFISRYGPRIYANPVGYDSEGFNDDYTKRMLVEI